MIRVNLLPAELEAAPTPINPAIPVAGTAILAGLIIIPVHVSKVAARQRLQNEATSLKSQLDRYQPIIAQVDALEAAKTQLAQRKTLIQQLESERLRYPQFMDDFVKLLPGNLWLMNLTTVSQPGGNINVSMDVQALDTYAIADLISNLETSQIFTDVELGTITSAQNPQGGQTLSFHINSVYKKVGAVTDATKKS